MTLKTLPFNWFDLAVLIVLAVGIFRGRKRGMSEELLPLLKWLCIVVACGMFYELVGTKLAAETQFSKLTGYLLGYGSVALGVVIVFGLVKKALGGKLVGSDIFGHSEYYLGMLAGMFRWGCMLIVALALLNARHYEPAEIQAEQKYQQDVYGSNFFPKLFTVQDEVFQKSLIGPWVRQYLGNLLIKPTGLENKQFKQQEFHLQ